jgi:hypothetical protein
VWFLVSGGKLAVFGQKEKLAVGSHQLKTKALKSRRLETVADVFSFTAN